MAAHAATPPDRVLRLAAPYIRPEARRLTVAATSSVIEVTSRLLSPWPLALVVDHALGGRPLTQIRE